MTSSFRKVVSERSRQDLTLVPSDCSGELSCAAELPSVSEKASAPNSCGTCALRLAFIIRISIPPESVVYCARAQRDEAMGRDVSSGICTLS